MTDVATDAVKVMLTAKLKEAVDKGDFDGMVKLAMLLKMTGS